MEAFITTGLLGAILIALGIMNMKGNISSLHWYHRQRVTDENRKPFGKLVGLGTLMIGVAIILFGILFWIYEVALMEWLIIMGSFILGVGIIAGLGLSFYAMIKYNKGIF